MWEISGGVDQFCDAIERGWARHWLFDLAEQLLERNDICMQLLRALLREEDMPGLDIDAPGSDGETSED